MMPRVYSQHVLPAVVVNSLINGELQIGDDRLPPFLAKLGQDLGLESVQLLDHGQVPDQLAWRKHVTPAGHPDSQWFTRSVPLRDVFGRDKTLPLPLRPFVLQANFSLVYGRQVCLVGRAEEGDLPSLEFALFIPALVALGPPFLVKHGLVPHGHDCEETIGPCPVGRLAAAPAV